MTAMNYYMVLEIQQSASDELVQAAIRKQRRRWMQLQGHPNLETRHDAERPMRAISEAETVLANQAKRLAYDLTLKPLPEAIPARLVVEPPPSPAPSRPEPWVPTPRQTRSALRPESKRRLRFSSGLIVLFILAVVILSGQLGGWVRGVTGYYPDFLRNERILQPSTSIAGGTDFAVGTGVLGIACFFLLAVILVRWNKVFGIVLGVIGIVLSLMPVVVGMIQFPGEAQPLIKSGLCNGGEGSSGRVNLDGRTVSYGLTGDCTGVVVWNGLELLRHIDVPGQLRLELFPATARASAGGQYIGAVTTATATATVNGGSYQAVLFRIDADKPPQVIALTAPSTTQGALEAGNSLFTVERQLDGAGVASGIDPSSGSFVWNVGCPASWHYLLLWKGDVACTGAAKPAAGVLLRNYKLDASQGGLGGLLEERQW